MSFSGSSPCFVNNMEKKFFAGLAWSLMAMVLPRSDATLSIPADFEPSNLRQPPWMPAVRRTSKPCSSGLSQRSAMPMPASALPVAIASSNCSVEPPKLTKSTSRLCLAKIPRSLAIGADAVQMAVAFQARSRCRGGPASGSAAAAVWQIGASPSARSRLSAPLGVNARAAPNAPSEVAAPSEPASSMRREKRFARSLLRSPSSASCQPSDRLADG